ncbi:MAG TPA: Tad domain-containing protein [Planctomicrobium sp.]|nr:Tad domain-containing protein [Planctomicrobium sp.]
MRRHRIRHSSSRPGQVLILFAFFLLAFMGVVGLIIDHGYARLARRQMQTAVNSAALEGLRWQALVGNGDLTDEERRDRARKILRLTLDEEFNPDNPLYHDENEPEAVPLLTGDGYQQVTTTDSPDVILHNKSNYIYRGQRFQRNMANEAHGDMVSGTWNDVRPNEEDNYSRGDFTPSLSQPDAFLVRMRRIPGNNPLDAEEEDEENGIHSHGPAVPMWFGLLSQIPATVHVPPGSQHLRRDGIPVRATAIAAARPAMTVGPEIPASQQFESIPGWAPFSIVRSKWPPALDDLSIPVTPLRLTRLISDINATATTLQVENGDGFPDPMTESPFIIRIDEELIRVTGGSLTNWEVERGVNGSEPSQHPMIAGSDSYVRLQKILQVGTPMTRLHSQATPGNSLVIAGETAYVPITDGAYVIGFGLVERWELEYDSDEIPLGWKLNPAPATVVRTSPVANLNAISIWRESPEIINDVVNWPGLWSAVETFYAPGVASTNAPVLAPALVRTIR